MYDTGNKRHLIVNYITAIASLQMHQKESWLIMLFPTLFLGTILYHSYICQQPISKQLLSALSNLERNILKETLSPDHLFPQDYTVSAFNVF